MKNVIEKPEGHNTRSVKMEDKEAETKAFVSGEATRKEKKVRFEGD